MAFDVNTLGLRDKQFLSYEGAPAGSQVNVSVTPSGTSAFVNAILFATESGTSNLIPVLVNPEGAIYTISGTI